MRLVALYEIRTVMALCGAGACTDSSGDRTPEIEPAAAQLTSASRPAPRGHGNGALPGVQSVGGPVSSAQARLERWEQTDRMRQYRATTKQTRNIRFDGVDVAIIEDYCYARCLPVSRAAPHYRCSQQGWATLTLNMGTANYMQGRGPVSLHSSFRN